MSNAYKTVLSYVQIHICDTAERDVFTKMPHTLSLYYTFVHMPSQCSENGKVCMHVFVWEKKVSMMQCILSPYNLQKLACHKAKHFCINMLDNG